MRTKFIVLIAAVAIASVSWAELQNIEVGGSLRIRGNWYTKERVSWDEDVGNDLKFVEQRTRLNVKADFTDEVAAMIELDSYDWWGEDFRSNYITGADARATTDDDVEVYQAYIEANEMWGYPLRMRVGRQELALGSQWLVGVNDTSSLYTGLSFDGLRLTYATDMVSVDAFWAKLAERSPVEEDPDVDLYGIYGSYLGVEDMTIDAYWLMVRDARRIGEDTNRGWIIEGIENWVDIDDYDNTYLHTVGLRGAGTYGAVDYEAEIAYQFGEVEPYGKLARWKIYGDDDADMDNLGLNAEVGYTFDTEYMPRVFLGGAFLEGEDNRTPDNFGEWLFALACPFGRPDANLSFNRLFSNWEYSEFLDGTDLTNVWLLRGGVSAMPTESLELMLTATYMECDDPLRIPRLFRFPWNPEEVDEQLGWEVKLCGTYHYSEDLSVEAGYAHLFVDDGLTGERFLLWRLPGNFVGANGLANRSGTDEDDPDYLYIETKIKF